MLNGAGIRSKAKDPCAGLDTVIGILTIPAPSDTERNGDPNDTVVR